MTWAAMACTMKEPTVWETSRTMVYTMIREHGREFGCGTPHYCFSPTLRWRFSPFFVGVCIGVCDLCDSNGEAQTPTSIQHYYHDVHDTTYISCDIVLLGQIVLL